MARAPTRLPLQYITGLAVDQYRQGYLRFSKVVFLRIHLLSRHNQRQSVCLVTCASRVELQTETCVFVVCALLLLSVREPVFVLCWSVVIPMASLRNGMTPTRSYSNYSSDSLRRSPSPAGMRPAQGGHHQWDSHLSKSKRN